MSSDDYIEVRENEQGEYDVSNKFVDGGLIEKIGHFTNLRDAMISAEDYQRKAEVPTEYGITFLPYSKEEDSLK